MDSENYTLSHSSLGYGKRYSLTYYKGYYFIQWNKLEKPILFDILSKHASDKNSSILDFACGTGRILLAMKNTGYKNLTGIDVSEEMLNQGRLADTSLNLIQTDIATEDTSCYLNSFDVITSFRFFTNADKDLKLKVLPKLGQFIKPKGILIVNFHQNSSSILGKIYLLRNFLLQKKIANV